MQFLGHGATLQGLTPHVRGCAGLLAVKVLRLPALHQPCVQGLVHGAHGEERQGQDTCLGLSPPSFLAIMLRDRSW